MPLDFCHPNTPHRKLKMPEWFVSSLMMDRAQPTRLNAHRRARRPARGTKMNSPTAMLPVASLTNAEPAVDVEIIAAWSDGGVGRILPLPRNFSGMGTLPIRSCRSDAESGSQR